MDVCVCDANLMAPRLQVNLGEDRGSIQLVHQFVDPRERVGVLAGQLVQGSVVDTYSEIPFLLDDK